MSGWFQSLTTSTVTSIVNALIGALNLREVLTGPRTYYARTAPVDVTISIAAPGVVTWNAHGLSANDPVVFAIRRFTTQVAISLAAAGVVNWPAHGLVVNQPFRFHSTGQLPNGAALATTYFVKTVNDANNFTFSATAGGAAITTTAKTVTFTNASATLACTSHGVVGGQQIKFATSVAGFVAGQRYWVASTPDADHFTLASDIYDGTNLLTATASTTSTLAGTHFAERTGTMPTGLSEGTPVYVKTVIDANSFTVSAAPGGAAIATTGTTNGIISASTGNDANDGKSQTRAGAKLTIQSAIDALDRIDGKGNSVTIKLAESVFLEPAIIAKLTPGVPLVTISGGATIGENCRVSVSNGSDAFLVDGPVKVAFDGLFVETFVGGHPFSFRNDPVIYFNANLHFGASAADKIGIQRSDVTHFAPWRTSGNAVAAMHHMFSASSLGYDGLTVTIFDNPTFGSYWLGNGGGGSFASYTGVTIDGSAMGQREFIHLLGAVKSAGVIPPGSTAAIYQGGNRDDFIAAVGFVGPARGNPSNTNAAAGNVGEFMTASLASGAAVGLTLNTPKSLCNITLTAGDWDVWGFAGYSGNAATLVKMLQSCISTAADTLDNSLDRLVELNYGNAGVAIFAEDIVRSPAGHTRITVAAGTTVTAYLTARSDFSTNVMSAYGVINARRVQPG